jgi:hypothetical protein
VLIVRKVVLAAPDVGHVDRLKGTRTRIELKKQGGKRYALRFHRGVFGGGGGGGCRSGCFGLHLGDGQNLPRRKLAGVGETVALCQRRHSDAVLDGYGAVVVREGGA